MQEELAPSKHDDPRIGKVLSERYELLSLIGEGGIGLVYKARHLLMNRLVAVKLIRAEFVVNQTVMQRFHQEAMAISKLNHPNIVEVYDFGVSEEGAPFLVMDYLEGLSLADVLSLEEKLSVKRAMPLFLQACQALKHAHEKGILHRDFKASNLVVVNDAATGETVRVVDFGMAKFLKPETDLKSELELTKSGEVFGSPLYMSPEQCRGKKLDARSDIYSLACIMYYAVAGRPPFLGENVLDTLQQQINDEAIPPSQFDATVPKQLDEIILKALRKEPGERYQHMSEMLIDLEAFNNGQESIYLAKKPKKSKKPWNRVIEMDMVFAGVVGVAVVAMTAFMSGRIFEAGETQEMNMWVDHNLDGNKARGDKQYTAAARHYIAAITEAMKFGKYDPRLAKSYLLLGSTYADDKQYQRAETNIKRAIQILEKCYGEDCFEESTALLELARVYQDQGRTEEAHEIRARVVETMSSTVGENKAITVKEGAPKVTSK